MGGTRHDAKDQRLDERGRKDTVGKDENPGIFAPQAKYTAMISLLVTALIAHFLVFDAMFQDGQLVWHLVAMHYVVPAMPVLDWLLFDEKGKVAVWVRSRGCRCLWPISSS